MTRFLHSNAFFVWAFFTVLFNIVITVQCLIHYYFEAQR